ncbi:MAG: translation elongation factor 4 [bacterium]|nr:translation elongation factor 4 [bacterium]
MDKRFIRNFVIIAHIDHGKSTLADRFLELTGTVETRKMHAQYLDTMDIEQERGITIKMQPVRMQYVLDGDPYTLDLIDTPGHVDFTYEVSRSLAAVEGAVLLVDATKGIQAQTLANLRLAQKEGLVVVPAINKIDLPNADPEKVSEELTALLGIEASAISHISAKDGIGVKELLSRVIKEVPSPKTETQKVARIRALVFDSSYDTYKGALAYVRVVNGRVRRGDAISFFATGALCEVLEVGYFKPHMLVTEAIEEGEIGYIATGLKDVSKCRVGDTITNNAQLSISSSNRGPGENFQTHIEPLPGYAEPRPMVFASFYPTEGDDFDMLRDALSKLKLNDAAITFEPETSEALGRGFRCGFLGMLHLEIAKERLRREFDIDLVVTTPSVLYKVTCNDEKVLDIAAAGFLPDPALVKEIHEPWVELDIVTPLSFMGNIMELVKAFRAIYKETEYLSKDHLVLHYEAPLAEIITNFYDRLKSVSSGYASMNYNLSGYRQGDLIKLDILVAGESVEAFSHIAPRQSAENRGRRIVERLKELIPQQLFAVSLQAAIGGKVIARETISAMRKDVTGYLYGGDYTRKRKLLEKQKKGKKKMKAIGRVNIPSNVFLEMLKE